MTVDWVVEGYLARGAVTELDARGDDENNAGAALAAMAPLQRAARTGLAVELTRHERKSGGEPGESARGSSAYGGAADIIVAYQKPDGQHPPTRRVLRALSRFPETPETLVVERLSSQTRGARPSLAMTSRVASQFDELRAGATRYRVDDTRQQSAAAEIYDATPSKPEVITTWRRWKKGKHYNQTPTSQYAPRAPHPNGGLAETRLPKEKGNNE